MNSIRAVILAACCLTAFSCATQRDPAPPASAPPTASPAISPRVASNVAGGTPSPEPGDTSTPDFAGSTGVTEKKRSQMHPALLKQVRAATHDKFDRIVFEFAASAVPGYRIEYASKPVQSCGSGDPVSVAGSKSLLIQMTPAQAHSEAGAATVTDRARTLNLPLLKEMKLICDFEADVQWVVGLSESKPYRVLELTNPARLVVDVRK